MHQEAPVILGSGFVWMKMEAQDLLGGHTTGKWWNKDSKSGPLSPELILCSSCLPKGQHSHFSPVT